MQGVYFIEDRVGRSVKIGHSNNIEARISGLQTSNPHRLELIAVWHGATMVDEGRLHRLFAHAIKRGEWFYSEPVKHFLNWSIEYNSSIELISIILMSASVSLEKRIEAYNWFDEHINAVLHLHPFILDVWFSARTGIFLAHGDFKKLRQDYIDTMFGYLEDVRRGQESASDIYFKKILKEAAKVVAKSERQALDN